MYIMETPRIRIPTPKKIEYDSQIRKARLRQQLRHEVNNGLSGIINKVKFDRRVTSASARRASVRRTSASARRASARRASARETANARRASERASKRHTIVNELRRAKSIVDAVEKDVSADEKYVLGAIGTLRPSALAKFTAKGGRRMRTKRRRHKKRARSTKKR